MSCARPEFATTAPGLDLVPLGQAVEQLRVVKDKAEIALLGPGLRDHLARRSTGSSARSGLA